MSCRSTSCRSMPRQNWGYTRIRPLVGTLPEDFPIHKMWHSGIDRQRNVATLPWGLEIDLAPFFGVMGVAPPPVYGACSSIQPREFGGNMDLKELVAGSTLYLPVWAPGALVLGRRRARRAGRRRSLYHRARNRARRHLPPHRAQGPEIHPAARRNANPPHHDGLQRRPRRCGEGCVAGDDRPDRRAPRPARAPTPTCSPASRSTCG